MQGALLSARDERNAIQEIVKADTTGRSIIKDYVKRTKDEKIVPNLKLIRYQTKSN
jgi:hypothetical protein